MQIIKNIMLVDDNKIDLFINQKIIEKYNSKLKVVSLACPLTALKYLRLFLLKDNLNYLERPNLILLDINMPLCNGFQFLDELGKWDYTEIKDLKIVVLSSSGCLYDINHAKNNPLCAGYIIKPLTIEKLHETINKDKRCLMEFSGLNKDYWVENLKKRA